MARSGTIASWRAQLRSPSFRYGERGCLVHARVIAGDATATLSRFPGHWYEPETGLHHNRWRYFDPASATYLSPEPLGLLGGLESYGYVNGKPLVWIDRDGLAGGTGSVAGLNPGVFDNSSGTWGPRP